MINKALFILFFLISPAFASDGLGMGGGPPADIINPILRPVVPTDSLNIPGINRLIIPNHAVISSEGIVCHESETLYQSSIQTSEVLRRWPLSEEADCMEPLKDFSQKLSLARAPLALSFATFIDGLEKHLSGNALRWKNCGSNCSASVTSSASCNNPEVLIKKTTNLISHSDSYELNKSLWDKLSKKQPRVCAATVVDLWLTSHVADKSKRSEIVNDFFSARFHANSETSLRCFDPTAATVPFDSLDGQIQNILLQIR